MANNNYGQFQNSYGAYQPQMGGFANNGRYYPVFPNQAYQQQSDYAQQFNTAQSSQPTQQVVPLQIAYVNGVEGAKAYTLAPNQQIWLLDTDSKVLYYKEADATCKSTIAGYTLTEIDVSTINKPKEIDMGVFATKADLQDAIKEIKSLFMSAAPVSEVREGVKLQPLRVGEGR